MTAEPPDVDKAEGRANGDSVIRERFRHAYSAEERKRILDTVLLERLTRWKARFTIMLVLSVVIASLGLLSDSTAIVIGAMLIAPLLSPIQALAVAIAMGWRRRIAKYAVVVVAASLGGFAIAWFIGLVIPTSSALPDEVLIRTSPDLRDLFIALAAGAAGAYATAREDVSSALPGVAVAVALVPPLATVGVTISIGHPELAGGAMLLYSANLVAILLAGIAVLLATGFVPLPHLERSRTVVLGATAVVALVTLLIGVPLTEALAGATSAAQKRERIASTVVTWLGDSDLELTSLEISGNRVVVDLSGPDTPPDVDDLSDRLAELVDGDADISVRWLQRADVVNGADVSTDAEVVAIREAATAWASEGGVFEVDGVSRSGDVIVVDVAGPEPPVTESFLAALADRGVVPESIRLRWTMRRVVSPGAAANPSLPVITAVERWAEGWDGLVIDEMTLVESAADDGDAVVVSVTGPAEPDDIDALEVAVRSADPSVASVTVEFRQQVTLTADASVRSRVERIVTSWAADLGLGVRSVTADLPQVSLAVAAPVAEDDLGPLADRIAGEIDGSIRLELRAPDGSTQSVVGVPPSAERTVVDFAASEPFPPDTDAALRSLVASLQAEDVETLVVIGHADPSGPRTNNVIVSRRRADQVRDRLVAMGADPSRVFVRADGESGADPSRRADVVALVE